jgi:hypothetical protein
MSDLLIGSTSTISGEKPRCLWKLELHQRKILVVLASAAAQTSFLLSNMCPAGLWHVGVVDKISSLADLCYWWYSVEAWAGYRSAIKLGSLTVAGIPGKRWPTGKPQRTESISNLIKLLEAAASMITDSFGDYHLTLTHKAPSSRHLQLAELIINMIS